MKQILITGGAGFIGSHLCARLLEEGNEVICLDNYFTGSKENVIPLLKNPHFELIRHDVSIPFQAEVDEIYNLACPASSSLLSNRSDTDDQDIRVRSGQYVRSGKTGER